MNGTRVCGRYGFFSHDRVAERLGVRWTYRPRASYNVAPTQVVPAVLDDDPGALVAVRWGLVPFRGPVPAKPLINARLESAAVLPSFRDAFRRRHAVLPADGFFEWRRDTGRTATPVWVSYANDEPLLFAALWEPLGLAIDGASASAAILTGTATSPALASIHERAPVALTAASARRWLRTRDEDPAAVLSSVEEVDPGGWRVRVVGDRVNDVRNDDETVLAPAVDRHLSLFG